MQWARLRADLNGSQQNAFEELCVQLARIATEAPNSRFIRLGTPDGGLEGYRVHADGTEHGWQAKFFTGVVGETQFSQLDDSVRRALTTHPHLTKYTICIPQNRSDPRREGQSWFMDRWNTAVARWTGWANERGMAVEFEYWGDSELDQMLREEWNAGRLWLWFGERVLTESWLQEAFEVTRHDAGQRYDPAVNVSLQIATLFSGLLRERSWFNDLADRASRVDEHLWGVERLIDDARFAAHASDAVAAIRAALDAINNIDPTAVATPISFAAVEPALENGLRSISQLQQRLRDEPLNEEERASSRRSTSSSVRSHEEYACWRLRGDIDALLDFARSNRSRLAGGLPLVVTGDAGSGKTHLLCDVAEARLREHSPALVLLGQWFRDADPLTQVVEKLHLDCTPQAFLQALSSLGECREKRVLLAFDALNESQPRTVWRNHLSGTLEILSRHPWIAVVVSCRTSYVQTTFPGGQVPERAITVVHRGFGDRTYDAVRLYFDHYGVAQPRTPLIMPEFRNPLFLRLFCRAMRGVEQVPVGSNGVLQVFGLFIDAVDIQLSQPDRLDYNRAMRPIQLAINELADAMITADRRLLPVSQAMSIADGIRQPRGWSDSLLNGLLTEGVLSLEAGYNGEEYVGFQYERLGDHLIAQRLLDELSATDLPAAFESGRLATYASRDRWDAIGVREALAIQLPERYGIELHDVAALDLEAFLRSVMWRRPDAFTETANNLIHRLLASESWRNRIFALSLSVAGQSTHPVNGLFLHNTLEPMSMANRDACWTTYINDSDEGEEPDQLIAWAMSVHNEGSYDIEPLVLASTALGWLLTASNRSLRDRATKALANVLTHNMAAASPVLERFARVNDPYVLERVAAAIYGAAMRTTDSAGLLALTSLTFSTFFQDRSAVPVHILTRDYLRGIVELGHLRGADVDVNRARPPYGAQFSEPPSLAELEAVVGRRGDNSNRGLRQIFFSVMDHDFGRYIIGTNSGQSDWLPTPLNQPLPETPKQIIDNFVADLNDDQKAAWEVFRRNDEARELFQILRRARSSRNDTDSADIERQSGEDSGDDDAIAAFKATLDAALAERFDNDVSRALNAPRQRERFDLRLIQRGIVDYAVRTGYDDALNAYDEVVNQRSYSRQPRSIERIGKKYQWQGLHEILARVADNFVFVGWEDEPVLFNGPWQTRRGTRDIDPSFIVTRKSTVDERRDWDRIAPNLAFGGADAIDYVSQAIREMLLKEQNSHYWLMLDGDYDWRERTPLGRDPYSVPRREVWAKVRAYIIRRIDAGSWFEWGSGQDWFGNWMPESPSLHEVFRGEFYWAPAFFDSLGTSSEWTRDAMATQMPIPLRVATLEYFAEQGTSDASLEETYNIALPSNFIASEIGFTWTGNPWSLQDSNGDDAALSQRTGDDRDRACWIRRDLLQEWLDHNELSVGWTILMEARTLVPMRGDNGDYENHVFAGAALLDAGEIHLNVRAVPRNDAGQDAQDTILDIYRDVPDENTGR